MHGSYLPKKCCIICTKLQWPGAADASGVVQCITCAAVHGGHVEQFLSFPWPGCCWFFHFWTQTRSFPGTWHLHAQLPFGHFLSKKPWSIPNVTYAKSDYCCFLPACCSLNVGVGPRMPISTVSTSQIRSPILLGSGDMTSLKWWSHAHEQVKNKNRVVNCHSSPGQRKWCPHHEILSNHN